MNIKTNRRGRSRQSVNIEGEYYYAKTWSLIQLQNGDNLEIVKFLGGG